MLVPESQYPFGPHTACSGTPCSTHVPGPHPSQTQLKLKLYPEPVSSLSVTSSNVISFPVAVNGGGMLAPVMYSLPLTTIGTPSMSAPLNALKLSFLAMLKLVGVSRGLQPPGHNMSPALTSWARAILSTSVRYHARASRDCDRRVLNCE